MLQKIGDKTEELVGRESYIVLKRADCAVAGPHRKLKRAALLYIRVLRRETGLTGSRHFTCGEVKHLPIFCYTN